MIHKKVIENNIPPTDLTKTIIIVTSNIPNLIGKKMVQRKRDNISSILLIISFLLCIYIQTVKSCGHHAPHDKNKELYCRRCGALITHSNAHMHVAPRTELMERTTPLPELHTDATLTHFQNPQGTQFGVATFCPATLNLEISGKPERRESFFPPYHWQVVTCKKCGSHLGWYFSYEKDASTGKCPLHVPFNENRKLSTTTNTSPTSSQTNNNNNNNNNKKKKKKTKLSAATIHMDEMDRLDSILKRLRGLCQAVSRGYWTYEWCFKKSIRQFHLEPLPKNYVPKKESKDVVLEVNKIKYLRVPDWSLGTYKLEKNLPTSMEWDKPKKNQIYISNHYIGGQHCDETGRGRYTEVR